MLFMQLYALYIWWVELKGADQAPFGCVVETAGFEPASVSPLPNALCLVAFFNLSPVSQRTGIAFRVQLKV